MFNTNSFFIPGKLSVTMDGGAGSSGKGKLSSFIGEHANNWQFCCNTFMSNAAHWVVLDDGTKYLFQSLNSVAYLKDKYEKMYICGGSIAELEPLLREIEEHNITPEQLGIHPLVGIVQQIDIDYERGVCNFDGAPYDDHQHSDAMKLGSTLHGVGAARARRILRRSDVLLARDIPQLKQFICWTDQEIVDRLDAGQSGLMEIAQGYQLSYLSKFYPKTTSRNCSVMAGLDDANIPPYYLGNIGINFRTFPIRVNSDKYVHSDTGDILTADDIERLNGEGNSDKVKVLKGDSGAWYDDQREITWDEVTAMGNHPSKISELSSLTRLERRVFTFSKQNLLESVRFNRGNYNTYISINFANYVDHAMTGMRSLGIESVPDKFKSWIDNNINPVIDGLDNVCLGYIGTGAKTDDMIQL